MGLTVHPMTLIQGIIIFLFLLSVSCVIARKKFKLQFFMAGVCIACSFFCAFVFGGYDASVPFFLLLTVLLLLAPATEVQKQAEAESYKTKAEAKKK